MRYFEKAISSAITPQNETVIVDFVIRVTLNTELQEQVALILAFAFDDVTFLSFFFFKSPLTKVSLSIIVVICALHSLQIKSILSVNQMQYYPCSVIRFCHVRLKANGITYSQ